MSLPVINVATMREWEKATWATGQTEAEVIRRVGQAIAQCALSATRSSDVILILAGKGHNGDDARAAKEFLRERKIILLEANDPKAALAEFHRCVGESPTLIIDGLFGIGLDRALDEDWIKLITAINESKIPVLAIDIPSGLNADTGEPFGAAIEAAITLTVGAPKIGLMTSAAWPFVGRLEVAADVGLIPCPTSGDLVWTMPKDFCGFPPRRMATGHKGSFGHLGILAGSLGYHGASVLATRGAQRAQLGLVTLHTQEAVYHVVAAQLQSAMVNVWKLEMKIFDNASAALIGPGLVVPELMEEMKALTRRLWRDLKLPLVVDASALDWIAAHGLPPSLIRVVTPHPGEAARMLNTTVPKVEANRPAALRDISRRFGNCWVVLKGHQTLIGRSEGEIFVNSSGNPHLAQGGSGDVLGGFIAGLLAQPPLQANAGKTIRYAVWQHGAAADALQTRSANWIVEDLLVELGNVR